MGIVVSHAMRSVSFVPLTFALLSQLLQPTASLELRQAPRLWKETERIRCTPEDPSCSSLSDLWESDEEAAAMNLWTLQRSATINRIVTRKADHTFHDLLENVDVPALSMEDVMWNFQTSATVHRRGGAGSPVVEETQAEVEAGAEALSTEEVMWNFQMEWKVIQRSVL